MKNISFDEKTFNAMRLITSTGMTSTTGAVLSRSAERIMSIKRLFLAGLMLLPLAVFIPARAVNL